MAKKLLLAGGGHAHMMLLAKIGDLTTEGHEVTVVQPSNYHYYSGMGPGMLSGFYTADDIRFSTRFVVERQGGKFIRDKVIRIDAASRSVELESGIRQEYDVLSCNTGSFIPFDNIAGDNDTVFSAKPIERLLEAQKKIVAACSKPSLTISIVGGGAAAAEIAGNVYHLATENGCPDIKVNIFAGSKLMKNASPVIQRIVRNYFEKLHIQIDESGHVERVENSTIIMENGQSHTADFIFLATGVKPSPLFTASNLSTGPDGGLLVNEYLQCRDHPEIFGGGDCIYYQPRPLEKVGVYAVRENPVLLNNVIASLKGGMLQPFDPGGNFLAIFNLGGEYGALQKGFLSWGGKLSFTVKDYIDRKFMKKFHGMEKE
ncbi:MAG: FAD-dependent oxidoreductase [Deltaproteobacteria bacterium]|nr:FAD-dependent oxidoreductase [Deltaproteobacteria bacterium]